MRRHFRSTVFPEYDLREENKKLSFSLENIVHETEVKFSLKEIFFGSLARADFCEGERKD